MREISKMNLYYLLALNSYAMCSLCGVAEIINYKFFGRMPKYLIIFIMVMISIFVMPDNIYSIFLGFVASYFYFGIKYKIFDREEIIEDNGQNF